MMTINRPDQSLPYHIRGAFRGFETALARYLANIGLPLSQFYILRLEWDEMGSQQNDIAEKACMTESVASQVIQKMEKAGLVTRKSDRKDARKRRVRLTSKGEKLRTKIMTDGIQTSRENAPEISREDMITTISVLVKVKNAFEIYNAKTAVNR